MALSVLSNTGKDRLDDIEWQCDKAQRIELKMLLENMPVQRLAMAQPMQQVPGESQPKGRDTLTDVVPLRRR